MRIWPGTLPFLAAKLIFFTIRDSAADWSPQQGWRRSRSRGRRRHTRSPRAQEGYDRLQEIHCSEADECSDAEASFTTDESPLDVSEEQSEGQVNPLKVEAEDATAGGAARDRIRYRGRAIRPETEREESNTGSRGRKSKTSCREKSCDHPQTRIGSTHPGTRSRASGETLTGCQRPCHP